MNQHETIKAHLNLYAVLQNLEDLTTLDPEMTQLIKNWQISIQFNVLGGPSAYIDFNAGKCAVGRGSHPAPTVKLFFFTPAHLNRMMDGKGTPVPLKGFKKLSFLSKEFSKLTDRLEYYLKPTDEKLATESYLRINTQLTMNTAAYAIRELGEHDPVGKLAVSHIRNGAVLMKTLPDGPSVHLVFDNGSVTPGKGDIDAPMARMYMRDAATANAFLNGKMDAFTAIAGGDVMIKGQIPMLDAMSLVLDRIPLYLS